MVIEPHIGTKGKTKNVSGNVYHLLTLTPSPFGGKAAKRTRKANKAKNANEGLDSLTYGLSSAPACKYCRHRHENSNRKARWKQKGMSTITTENFKWWALSVGQVRHNDSPACIFCRRGHESRLLSETTRKNTLGDSYTTRAKKMSDKTPRITKGRTRARLVIRTERLGERILRKGGVDSRATADQAGL